MPALRLPWRKIAFLITLLLGGAYLAVGGVFYFLQDALIFHPSTYPPGKLEKRAAREGFEPWRDEAGRQIGWESLDGREDDVLLVFHGQGGHALMGSYLRQYAREFGGDFQTYLLEYPGNGNRPGTPSEKALTEAGVAAIDLLARQPGRRIWVVGQSLGSGVACAVVRERPKAAAGVILLTPFDSLAATAGYHYPYFPVGWFLRTRFDSARNLAEFPGPVAILACEKDTSVPVHLARRLHDGFSGPKRLWVEPEADHDATGLLRNEWTPMWTWLRNSRPQ